ncbi:MAG: hypothetical protein ABIR70_02150 [Bryobacteraceae bacterium]
MRQPPEYFGEQELDLIYVAKKLDEALRLEVLLDQTELDYLVEPDKYKGGVIFQSERIGAFFYVAPEHTVAARATLAGGGYKPYDVENP